MIISLIILIATLVVVYLLFVRFYPSFGGDVTKEKQLQYASPQQFDNGNICKCQPGKYGHGVF